MSKEARVIQGVTKGVQVLEKTALFAKRTDHASQRGGEGRRTHTAFYDAQQAGPNQVFIQDDGRWVVIGPKGRAHIFFPDGTLHTTLSFNTKRQLAKKIQDRRWQRVSESQYEQFRNLLFH